MDRFFHLLHLDDLDQGEKEDDKDIVEKNWKVWAFCIWLTSEKQENKTQQEEPWHQKENPE